MRAQGVVKGTLTVLLVLAVGGCERPGAGASEEGAKLFNPFRMRMDTPMSRKPGLWEISNRVEGAPGPVTMSMCVDKTMGGNLMIMTSQPGQMDGGNIQCPQGTAKPRDGGLVIDQTCKLNGTTMTNRIEVTPQGEDAFRQTVTTRYTPAYQGRTESTTVMEGRWKGACPDGMKAGDVRMPGGMTVNMSAMAAEAAQKKP